MRAITVNESQNFVRGKDVKGSLGVGMWGQIKQLMREQGKKVPLKDLVNIFLICSEAGRPDLEDFLLSKGLDINSKEHEILRVLAWIEKDDDVIRLVQNRGADIEGAIRDADAHNEWKTVRRLEEIKEKL